MSIVSYAQNFEDVMLWRALGHVSNGFYIDVGAQHPVIDSVSKAFYEHGWRGIHVEATPVYANLVRADRPDEVVLQVALSDKPGSLTFYEIPDTGLSTGDASIAEHHRSRGYKVVETVVPCITLADVFAQLAPKDVHWLKIDVEGMEAQVLSGWGDRSERPWVLVVESTYPNSQVETHHEWESMVLARGYVHAYFDGLSRYYALADRPDLAQKFNTPPNIFDGFSLAPSVPYNAPTRELMLQKKQLYQDELIGERTNSAHELQALRETLAEREDALGAHISQLQHQVATASEQQTAALAAHNADAAQQMETLSRQHTEREQAIARQLQTSQEERLRLQQERIEREQALIEQINQAKQEVQSLLRTQVQREQDFGEKVEALRSKAEQESAELSRTFTAQQDLLHSQHAAREQALNQRLEAEQEQRKLLQQDRAKREQTLREQSSQAKREVERLLRNQAQREREVLAQLLAEQQQAKREKAELTRSHAEKVRELGGQQAQREKSLTQQLHAHQQEIRNLQKDRVKRNQETAQAKADLLQKQSEKEQALHRQHAERKAALAQQLQELQQLLQRQHQDGAQLENALNSEIAALQSQTEKLQQAQQLQARQHSLELGNKLDEHSRLLEGYSALEAQLQAEMKSGQQANLHLRQLLSEMQHRLEMTHASLSWRITAPLRKLAGLLNSNKNKTLAPGSFSTPMPSERGIQLATASPPITVNKASLEPTMPLLAQATPLNMPTTASTLPELLAYHDQHFVHCAYLTILGREPDPEGMSYYLARLRIGYSKMGMVMQLCTSNEGKAHAIQLTGLDNAIKRYQRGRYYFIGWLFRFINDDQSDYQIYRRLRSIENQIHITNSDNHRNLSHLEQIIINLSLNIERQNKSIITILNNCNKTVTTDSELIFENPPNSGKPKELSIIADRQSKEKQSSAAIDRVSILINQAGVAK